MANIIEDTLLEPWKIERYHHSFRKDSERDSAHNTSKKYSTVRNITRKFLLISAKI